MGLITGDFWRGVDIRLMSMPGKPFQSKLEPHFDFIREIRRKRQTWDAIAQLLTAHGTPTTKQAVHAFLKRRLKRRYALGMAPAAQPLSRPHVGVKKPLPQLPELTESFPPPSEIGPDPLTLPPKDKKPMWNQII
jgi:hypothetical protein